MDTLPSPVMSPHNSPLESPSTPINISRKRARSTGSQASSSKRAMSEDPSTSYAVDPPRSSASSQDKVDEDSEAIDAYMRDQGEQDVQRTAFKAQSCSPPHHEQLPVSSPLEKLQLIKRLKNRPMVPGETWYVVSRSWYRKWEKACTGELDKEGAILESQLGPVDNSSFFQSGSFDASQSMIEGIDVEFVPSGAWNAFVQWYGKTRYVMARPVITRGFDNEVTLELRPICLRVSRLLDDQRAKFVVEKRLAISSQAKLADLFTELLEILDLPPRSLFRAWVVDASRSDGLSFASPLTEEGRLLPSDEGSVSKTIEESLIQMGDRIAVELQENGKWPVDEAGKSVSTASSTESPAPVFSSGSDFFSKLGANSTKKVARSSLQSTALIPSPSIATSSSYGKPERRDIVPGTIGFANMGNTCFMNSALQCLAHAQELVEYFLMGVYVNELNPDNPLGMQGAIAEAFGALLDRVWQPQNSTYAPREFKMQLQRFAPQFSGYQQHDSQELVAFLLDGLHEDLNRVLKKPYVEKPDWNGGGDKELVMLAKESWDGYKKRNDSVIVDLFQGQYRSTLICPECSKISITFDPFMYLTLPLPVQKKWTHTILYVPWGISMPHVKVPVEVNKNASFREVRQLLARWTKAEPDNLLTLEMFSNRFYKYLDDTVPVSDMSDADHIVCFELPCHAQQSRNWSPSSDRTENVLILPVHLCTEIPSSLSSFQRPSSGFAPPFVIALDYEQRRDRGKIYTAIVERLERWTKHARDLYHWEEINSMDEIQIREPLPKSSLTEIKENGDVITVEEETPEEGDVTDEKQLILESQSADEKVLRRLGPKPDLFEMHIQSGHDKLGVGSAWNMARWECWESREGVNMDGEKRALLSLGDAIYCEWDGNFRSYFFGVKPQYEHALWADSHRGEFVHPEFKEMREASTARSKKYISLDDCLQEFTKEEQLGEDDLWYCPQCKKHQQATKKFDVWTIPDILVVHLKRFSNSRILRDKLDAFVDFPIEGLDLTSYSGEREAAKHLVQQGQDLKALGLSDLDEPLIYDLFAVDEHMGGLGGGHYIAYAKNHETSRWYQFDDSHVSPAEASDSVNANAYLLFYKRCTSRPTGGKTFEKVSEARQQSLEAEAEDLITEVQLPTPPDEEDEPRMKNPTSSLFARPENLHRWSPLDSSPSRSGVEDDENAIGTESDLENEIPTFEEPQIGPHLEDLRFPGVPSYSSPNPESIVASPASSNAAVVDGSETPDMDFADLDDENTTQDEPRCEDASIEIPVGKNALYDIDM